MSTWSWWAQGSPGLVAAREVVKAGGSALVLEARDRVGGRTWSRQVGGQWIDLGGQWIDLGGQWIGPGQHRMARLTRELGLETFPTWAKGRKILDLHGKVSTYAEPDPRASPRRASLVLPPRPAPRREDARPRPHGRSLGPRRAPPRLDARRPSPSWQRRRIPSRAVRDVFDVAVRTIFGAESSELSLLYFLAYRDPGACGRLMHLVEIENGAQQDRFVLGAQSVSAAARGGARRSRGALRARAPHRSGRRGRDRAHRSRRLPRRAGDRRRAPRARRPHRLHAAPAGAPRRADVQRMAMGATMKCMATYESPFWRERGLSGEVASAGGLR